MCNSTLNDNFKDPFILIEIANNSLSLPAKQAHLLPLNKETLIFYNYSKLAKVGQNVFVKLGLDDSFKETSFLTNRVFKQLVTKQDFGLLDRFDEDAIKNKLILKRKSNRLKRLRGVNFWLDMI